jgi:hypothetical protein
MMKEMKSFLPKENKYPDFFRKGDNVVELIERLELKEINLKLLCQRTEKFLEKLFEQEIRK